MELSRKSVVIIGAVLGAAALGLYTIAGSNDKENGVLSTNPSRTDSLSGRANTSTDTDSKSVRAEGRVATYPGSTVQIGAEVGGRIVRLYVQEQQVITQGTVIAEIAADEERAVLAEARARLKETDANITFLTTELQRAERLSKTNSIPRQGLDKATRDLESAQAARSVAAASVRRIEAALNKMKIVAPIGGTVTSRYVEQGEIIGAGTRIVTIANLDRRRIEAEIDEYDLGRIHIGDSVNITAEGFDSQAWPGVIEMIPDFVARRNLEPTDPGRALDTRVLLVKITLPQDSPLKLGQRVEVEIRPKSR